LIGTVCGAKSYNKTQPTIVLPLVYCPVDNTSFEISQEIRCSGVSCRYCCHGNHTNSNWF